MYTVEKAEECLNELESAFHDSYKNRSPEKHQNLVSRLIDNCHYPVLIQRDWTNLYRVREGDATKVFDDKHFFSNVNEFHVNPNTSNIGQGRCNHEGVQVFYCAFEERTAQYEAIASFRESNNGDVNTQHIAYIGRWLSTRELNVANFSGVIDTEEYFQSDFPEWADLVKKLELFFRYVFSLPSNGNPAIYALTATITEKLLTLHDGVAYPSSCTNGEGVNLALNVSLSTDDSLTFHNAARVRRTEYKGDKTRIDNWIGMATDEDGTLLWMPSAETVFDSPKRNFIPYAYQSS